MGDTPNKIKQCPFCGSKAIYQVRHDSDWGGGNSFRALNESNYYPYPDQVEETNLDINTNFCEGCYSFGDFEKILENQKTLQSMYRNLTLKDNHLALRKMIQERGLSKGCHDLRSEEEKMLTSQEWRQFNFAYHSWNGDSEEFFVDPDRMPPDFAIVSFINHLMEIKR